MERWLVTGGCGFIGVNLVHSLLAEGPCKVRVIDDLSTGTREALAAVAPFTEVPAVRAGPMDDQPGLELVVGDILDRDVALRVSAGARVVVHLAANTGVAPSVENPYKDCYSNVIGILNYLEAARHNQVQRFVFASSGAVLGACVPPLHENLAPHPVSPYGASKLAGEAYCSVYAHIFGVETVSLRFGNVYGPRSAHKSSAVARFISGALLGQTIEVYGDGKQTRDFIFVDDLISALKLSATKAGVSGEVFQIATNRETSVVELIDALQAAFTRAGIRNVTVRHGLPRQGDVRRNYSDTSKARRMLGWKVEVSLADGLARTLSWFMENRARQLG